MSETTDTKTRRSDASTRKTRTTRTPEERAAEVEALAAQLSTAVAELTASEAWVRMLRVAARFTRYSPTNVLLLWMQAEQRGVSLSRVAGYRAWQAVGRQVVKGARSFAVRAPVRRRLTMEEAAERARTGQRPAFDVDGRPAVVVRGFRLERVFRFEETEGEPLPEAPEVGYVTGDTPAGAWDALAALVARAGYRLTVEAEDGETRGHTNFTERVVNVDPQYELAEQVHILVHELGHIRGDHENRRDVARAQRETEAESVAFIVCTVLGLQLGEVAAVHVGGWTVATRIRSLLRRRRSTPPPAGCWPTWSSTRTRRTATTPLTDGGVAAGLSTINADHAGEGGRLAVVGPSKAHDRATRWSPRGGDGPGEASRR